MKDANNDKKIHQPQITNHANLEQINVHQISEYSRIATSDRKSISYKLKAVGIQNKSMCTWSVLILVMTLSQNINLIRLGRENQISESETHIARFSQQSSIFLPERIYLSKQIAKYSGSIPQYGSFTIILMIWFCTQTTIWE